MYLLVPMINYNITINEDLAKIIEREMKRKRYGNKSEFFRELIRKTYLQRPAEYVIEELDAADPDFRELQKLKKKEKKFVPLKSLLA